MIWRNIKGKYKYKRYLYAESNQHSSRTWRNQCLIYLDGKCQATAYGCVGKSYCAKYKLKMKNDLKKIGDIEEKRQNNIIAFKQTHEPVSVIVEINLKKEILESINKKIDSQGFYNLRGFATNLSIKTTSDNLNVKRLVIRVGNKCYSCNFKNKKDQILISNNIATLYFEITELQYYQFIRKYKSIGTCSDVFYGQINFRKI